MPLQIRDQLLRQFISVRIFPSFSSEYICNTTDAHLHTLKGRLLMFNTAISFHFNELSIQRVRNTTSVWGCVLIWWQEA